jgi:hypothetical protein
VTHATAVSACRRRSAGFQKYQHLGGEPAARVPGTTDGVADPDDFQRVVAAVQRFLGHAVMIGRTRP